LSAGSKALLGGNFTAFVMKSLKHGQVS